MRKHSLLLLVFLAPFLTFGQYKKTPSNKGTVAFYNIENLFDTIDDKKKKDEDFTPSGRYQWDDDKYGKKLKNMSIVISKIGDEDGPEVLGLAEVENRKVLEDLIATPLLKDKGYKIVHFESPDFRGIDVALLYKESFLKVTKSITYTLSDPASPRFITRDILVVEGNVGKDKIYFLVNHWPSRRGGKEEKRALAAQQAKHIVDSLQTKNKKAKIILMGDFNDDPTDVSLTKHLGVKNTLSEAGKKDLFNTIASTFTAADRKSGTLSYKGKWNIFDQMIITKSLMGKKGTSYVKNSSKIYKQDFLFNQSGKYKGYLHRTSGGGKFLNGYSDHLPVYIYLKY